MKLNSSREKDAADSNKQNRNQLADTSFYHLKLMSGEQTEVLVYIIKKKFTPKKNTSWPSNLALCSSVFSERRFVRGSTWSLPSSWTPMKYWSSPYIYKITDEYDHHTDIHWTSRSKLRRAMHGQYLLVAHRLQVKQAKMI